VKKVEDIPLDNAPNLNELPVKVMSLIYAIIHCK